MQRKSTPQELEKAQTEATIILTLQNNKGKLRWKILKEKTKNSIKSPRTLSLRLQELQKKGIIRRIIDTSVYPPAVFYELSSNAVLLTSKPNRVIHTINLMKNQMQDFRELTEVFFDKDFDVEDFLYVAYRDFLDDFLITLKFSFEQPELVDHLIFISKELYASRLQRTFALWLKKPELKLKEAINKTIAQLEKESKEERQKFLEKTIEGISDKLLARAIVELYLKKMTESKHYKNAYDFLIEVVKTKSLKSELEKICGNKISKQRLNKIVRNPNWKRLTPSKKFKLKNN